MRRAGVVLGAGLLLAAVALPPGAVARALHGEGPHLAQVVQGAWILKAMLLVHGLFALLLARRRGPVGEGRPLLEEGLRLREPPGRLEVGVVAGLLALGLALRLLGLDTVLWFDEIDTLVHYARLPLGRVLTTFDSQNQHLLYSAFARLSIVLFGESAWALRLPAALFGVLSLGAMWRLARLLTGRREALFATALLAVSYHHVWFSQNARGYTALLFFTLVGTEALLRMLAAPPERVRGLALVYALAMALATLTHATAALTVVAHGLVWIVLCVRSRGEATPATRWSPLLAFGLAGTLTLLGYALVLPQITETLLAPTMPGQTVEWKSPAWMLRETVAGISRGLPQGNHGTLLLVMAAVVAALGTASYARHAPAVLAVLLLPAVVTAGALMATRHNLWPRFFFASAGFMVLIGLRGLTAWVRLFTRVPPLSAIRVGLERLLLGLFVLANASILPVAYGPKQDFLGAYELLRAQAAPGDAVVTLDMAALAYSAYLTTTWPRVDTVEELAAIEAAHPRTWVVYTTPARLKAEHPELWARLTSDYHQIQAFHGTLGGSEVVVLRNRP